MRFPHERMAASPHDRIGVRRLDEAWLQERREDPATRVLPVAGTRVRTLHGAPEWLPGPEAPDGDVVLLGERDGTTHLAVLLAPPESEDRSWLSLRDLLPGLVGGSVADASLVFHALGIAEWVAATRFCQRCAGGLHLGAAGHELHCAQGHRHFPRSDPAVIMAVTRGEPGSEDEQCLLGHNRSWLEGRYSTLAGFYEPGETLEDTVRREVVEESGIEVGEVTYFGNQPWPLPGSLMLGFLARATSSTIVLEDDDVEDARWFTRSEMRAEAEAGTLVLPGGVSISRSLIEHWYGGPLPGSW